MRIFFTRFPLESTHGGAEIQTISLMKGLLERGHAVAFAGSCQVLLELCKKEGITSAEVDIGPPPVTKWGAMSFLWRKGGMKEKLEGMLDTFEGVQSEAHYAPAGASPFALGASGDGSRARECKVKSERLDVICMMSLSEKLLLTKSATKKGVRVVWIEHDRVGRWLEKNPWLPKLRELSHQVITIPVSHLSGKIYEKLGWDPARIKPIPNGVEATRRTHDRTSDLGHRTSDLLHHPMSYVRTPKSENRLLCIARLSYEKGVDVLIEAMAGLPDTVTLEIVGTGREEWALKQLAKKLHLDHRIRFTGHLADLSEVYARADALILPSRDNDPFGLVAAEAMMLGIPVIVTDQCGIAGYLQQGKDVIIAQAGSSSSLQQAIEQLQLPATRHMLQANSTKTAHEKFSVERMVSDYESVFTDASLFPSVS